MSRCLNSIKKHANRNIYNTTNVALRTAQCITAILVAALSGVDLGRWSQSGSHADSRWIYAQVVSVLSTLVALACGFRQRRRRRRRAKSTASLVFCVFVQALLSLLWMVLSAVYGQLVVDTGAAAKLDFTDEAVEAALAFSIMSACLWLADAVAECASKAGKVEAEEQGGQGVDEDLRVRGLGGRERERKAAQEMREDDGQDLKALPRYSEVESMVDSGKGITTVEM